MIPPSYDARHMQGAGHGLGSSHGGSIMTHGCGCHHHDTTSGPATSDAGLFRADHTVAEVSRRSPEALEAMKRLGLNHCCGAHLTLAEAAASAGLSVNEVLDAVNGPRPTEAMK
jgi:hypothetical protein